MKPKVEKRLYVEVMRKIAETNVKLQEILRYHKSTLTTNGKLKKEYEGFLAWTKTNEKMLQKICDSINELEWFKNSHLVMQRDLDILKKAHPDLFKVLSKPPPFPKSTVAVAPPQTAMVATPEAGEVLSNDESLVNEVKEVAKKESKPIKVKLTPVEQ